MPKQIYPLLLSCAINLMGATNNAMPCKHLVILGCHGAGKDTCVNYMLSKRPNLVPILPGQIIRDEIKQQTELGKVLQPLYEGSNLSQQYDAEVELNKLASVLVCDKIQKDALTHKKPFILNGFPRTPDSFLVMHRFFEKHALCNDIQFIFLSASPSICLDRIQTRMICSRCSNTYSTSDLRSMICPCGAQLTQRATDKADVAQKRIEFYGTHMLELKSTIKEKEYPLIEINAELPLEEKKNIYDSILNDCCPLAQATLYTAQRCK